MSIRSIASNPWLPAAPSLQLTPPCGCIFVQKMCASFNRVVKDKLLLKKVKDHALEDVMKTHIKYVKLRRVIEILRKQPLQKMPYRYLVRRGKEVGLQKPEKMSDLLKKYSPCFEVYQWSEHRELFVRQSQALLDLLEEEKKVKQEQTALSVLRLRKLLMMSATRTIRLQRIAFLREELGLPDGFEQSILQQFPEHFEVMEVDKWSPLVKLLSWDPALAIPVIEKKRQKRVLKLGLSHVDTQRMAFAFPVSHPPQFKITKGYRSKLRKWQTLPYKSPYQDSTKLNLKSLGAFKRAVAVLHEYLHLTVEKKTRAERFAHLGEDFKLPQKVRITALQHPGIFYVSTKGTGKTIFLREAYRKGELREWDVLHNMKDKFIGLARKKKAKTLNIQRSGEKEDNEKSDVDLFSRQKDIIQQRELYEVEMLEDKSNSLFKQERSSSDEKFNLIKRMLFTRKSDGCMEKEDNEQNDADMAEGYH